MTALLGHLMDTEFTPEWKPWRMGTLQALFNAQMIKRVKPDMKGIADNLRQQGRVSQVLIIWTDCDREGENIGAEVLGICREVNPNIIVRRAKFSVVQRREIMHAWEHLIDLDLRAAAAVDARMELDLRIGAVFTRFQTLGLQKRFSGLKNQVISYGSCQFPTLGFVVDRFRKAKEFISEKFWSIKMTFKRDDSTTEFVWARDRLFDEDVVRMLLQLCKDNPVAVVTSVEAKPKSRWTPLPLTTVELQKVGTRVLKMSSDRIMHVAEELYNQGILSYPRTETDIFEDNFQLHPLIQKQTNDPQWGNYAAELLAGKFRKPRKGKHNDHAHPPIHPVRAAFNLEGDQKRIFEFVTRRFLACCSAPAQGQETTVHVQLAGEFFKATGLTILERNFLDVYPYDKWAESYIPNFTVGERFQPTTALHQGNTTPPSLLTEADLITLMDQSGIGTDATIHEHIKKILDREYATKQNGFFYPTTLGMALVTAYDEMNIDLSLSKPLLRSMMESSMKRICDGDMNRDQVVHESIQMYRTAFDTVFQQSESLVQVCARIFEQEPDLNEPIHVDPPDRYGVHVRPCPKCNMSMTLRNISNGERKMIGCTGYPNCKEAVFIPDFVTSIGLSESICANCTRPTASPTPTNNVFKVVMSFRPNSVPMMIPNPHETCLWCDLELRELFEQSRGGGGGGSRGNASAQNVFPSPQQSLRVPQANGQMNPRQQFPPSMPAAAAASGPRQPLVPTFPSSTNNQGGSASDAGPNCACGLPMARRIVRKEGPNQGRPFFGCSKPQDDTSRCNMFQWEDDPTSNASANRNVGNGYSSNPSFGAPADLAAYQQASMNTSSTTDGADGAGDTRPRCMCNLLAVFLKSKPDGPHNGRMFYKCPKQAAQCKFFSWADEVGQAGNSVPRSSGGMNNSGSNACYKCGEPGHFANACPNPSNQGFGRGFSRGSGRGRGRGSKSFGGTNKKTTRGRGRSRGRGRGAGRDSLQDDF